MPERVLFVHAHPADIGVQCGGTIAKLVANGGQVSVLTVTRSERAPLFPDGMAVIPGDLESIGDLREREARIALSALGVTDARFLGAPAARHVGAPPRRYVDSGERVDPQGRVLPAEDPHPESLVAADPDELAEDIEAVIAATAPTAIITDDIEAPAASPDTIRTYEAVVLAAQTAEVPVYVASDGGPGGHVVEVDVLDQLETKKLAIASHASQVAIAGNRVRTSTGEQHELADIERYRLVPRTLHPVAPQWPEPGGSLTRFVLGVATSFAAGLVVGGVAAIAHKTEAVVFGATVPIGLILGGIAAIGLVLGLRILSPSRLLAGLATIGMTLSVLGLGVRGFETVWVFDDSTESLLTAVVPLIAAVIITAWPEPGAFARLRALATRRRPSTVRGAGQLRPGRTRRRERSVAVELAEPAQEAG